MSYNAEHIIGNGSFGVVFQAVVVETGEVVAIKKVLQDKRFKNRELQIMRMLVKKEHPNIVCLKHCFYSNGDKVSERPSAGAREGDCVMLVCARHKTQGTLGLVRVRAEGRGRGRGRGRHVDVCKTHRWSD